LSIQKEDDRNLCTTSIKVFFEASEALLEAINPDNIIVPEWLSINCKSSPGVLECSISIDCSLPSRILSLRNTLDDLLRAIKVGIEVIESSRYLKKER